MTGGDPAGKFWQGKRVLVTGAGGFIGSHLAEHLARAGARTRGFVRYNSGGSWGWLDMSSVKQEIEVFQGDVCDADSVRKAVDGIEVVFHLAALIGIPYSYSAPASYVATNVAGTLNVLRSSLEIGVARVVQTSTSEVYGTARYVPIDEDHPLQGQSPYSATKIGADMLAESYYRSFGLPVTTVRPFNTFGPRQSARAVIPTIITQALAGQPVRLGNLSPTRDLNYVADTVAGFLAAAGSTQTIGEVINLGSGREISIGELARTILALMDKMDLPIESAAERLRPDQSEVDRLLADNTKARRLAGWAPGYSLEDGLRLTIDWLSANTERYRTDVYVV